MAIITTDSNAIRLAHTAWEVERLFDATRCAALTKAAPRCIHDARQTLDRPSAQPSREHPFRFRGTAFSLTAATKTTLHEFGRSLYAGAFPESGLVAVGGAMYGTTLEGGHHDCVVTTNNGFTGCGAIFRILPSGKLESVYDFRGGADQAYPHGLTLVGDKLYGKVIPASTITAAVRFSRSRPDGHETTIYSFGGTNDGCNPDSGLLYANHTLYGTTAYGGTYDDGTIFSITLSR